MKIIINADADDTDAVLHLIHQKAVHFAGPERLGWGWSWSIPNGKRFFISQIKGGFSARPAKEPRP